MATKQEWMIWARDPWQWYEATPQGFCIVNGRFTYNRVLHGAHGPMKVLAGDRPQIRMAETPDWRYGDLSFYVQRGTLGKWMHEFQQIEAIYNAGGMCWNLTDSAFPGLELRLEVYPLPDAPGLIARLWASEAIEVLWLLGNLGYAARSILGQGPTAHEGGARDGGVSPQTATNSRVTLEEGHILACQHPQCPKTTRAATSPAGRILIANPDALPRMEIGLSAVENSHKATVSALQVGPESAYLALLTNHDEDAHALKSLLDDAAATYHKARQHGEAVQTQAIVETPHTLLNQAVRGISSTLDACWLPPSYLHGAVRWGVECKGWFLGWRGWYGPTCLGWYERVAAALRFHARQQIQEGEQGYMSRGKLHDWVGFDGSYGGWVDGNMGEVYLDHLYHYYCWTGDKPLLRELWPTLRDALAWEQRTLDTDGDHLYENHINTWISDGHWYSGGPGAQASAYMYRAHLLAAEAAELVGENPQPYRDMATAIREAMNTRLWMAREGHYAEYQEYLEPHRLHEDAELPTIYHPIDSEVTDPFQAYQSLRYVEERLWLPNDLLLVNDWYPVIVTNGTIAFQEILHTALSYFQLGDNGRGWRLLQASLMPFVKARVPGTISSYGGWEGEQGTYTEFTDTSSMFARTVIEGLFGIRPQRQHNLIVIQPNLPTEWPTANLTLRDLSFALQRDDLTERVTVTMPTPCRLRLRLRARYDIVEGVWANGQPAEWRCEPGIGRPFVVIDLPAETEHAVQVRYRAMRHALTYPQTVVPGHAFTVAAHDCTLEEVYDPQGLLQEQQPGSDLTQFVLRQDVRGPHTFFLRATHGNTTCWEPVDVYVRPALEISAANWQYDEHCDDLRYAFTLRNNLPHALRLTLKTELLGQGTAEAVTLPAQAELRLTYPLRERSRLSPGRTLLHLQVSGDWQGALQAPLLLWQPSTLWDGLSACCVPLDIPYNGQLESLFRQNYYDTNLPPTALRIMRDGLNAWTGSWYRPDYINLDHVRARLDAGDLFYSDVGVPFRQVRAGNNGLFASRWEQWPREAVIPVNRQGRKLYLLLAGTTLNNQTRIANGRLVLRYADGNEQAVELTNPDNYDHLLQHFSQNYPQHIGGAKEGYYGVGNASGTHADILDIPLDAGRVLASLRVECIAPEIIIGVLAATILE
ncbi:MAG: DUF4450 domain-containing protein [Chloroflexi bacterium]|nr:DUF4450 domain-containing protein [Chloroflexota bacterium]